MKEYLAKPEHEVAYQELCALLKLHSGELTAVELLAIAANLVGKLIAVQDQQKVSRKQAMDIVTANIVKGNREVVESLCTPKGFA